MAAYYMTDEELEQFFISNIKETANAMSNALDRNDGSCFFFLSEKLSNSQEILVNRFGWSWEDVEALELSAY